MGIETLWESICHLAGPNGLQGVEIHEAVGRSAVNEAIANVELRNFERDGLIQPVTENRIELTVKGRERCHGGHHTEAIEHGSDPEVRDDL
jgi:hypothetical protein